MKKHGVHLLVGTCVGGLMLAACSFGTSVSKSAPTNPGIASTTLPPTSVPGGQASTTTTDGTNRCVTANMVASIYGSNGAAGTIETTVVLKNTSSSLCTLFGYPGLGLTGSNGAPLPTTVVRNGHYSFTNMVPASVTLMGGQSAYFNFGYSDVPTGSATSCPTSANLVITPPNSTSHLVIPAELVVCNNGTLTVSPVFSGTDPGAETTAPPHR